jgi:hypothetical protein
MEGRSVGSEIKNLVDDLERANPDLSATARVKKAWNTTVDSSIREHVTAVFVVPNTEASEVIIYIDSSIWATELTMQSELLRLQLNIELTHTAEDVTYQNRKAEQVEKLTFKVSKEQYTSKEKRLTTFELLEREEEKIKRVKPIELDEEELQSIQEAAAHIENDTLREAAYSAAKKSLEWKKGLENQ